MADILVRIPKAEEDHFWEDTPVTNISWWTLSQKPRNLEAGEYIYFLQGSKVVAKALIGSIQEDELTCEQTGREWKGVHICWIARDLEKLEDPVEGPKLTRGFRYYEPD